MTSDEALARYEDDGYVVLESLLSPAELAAVRDELAPLLAVGPRGRNDFEGYASQRVYGLLAKAPSVAALVEHPGVVALLDRLLQLNYLLTANLAINLLPGETAQRWHFDDGFYPFARPRRAFAVSTIWAIDDFTEDNGATELIPGSHRWGDETPDERPRAARAAESGRSAAAGAGASGAVKAVMPAGSVLVFSGQLWHRGGANTSAYPRCCVTPQYCEPWARQQENMILAVGDRAASLSPRVQAMLGYSIHPPFMGHVDGLHPRRLIEPAYASADHADGERAAQMLEGR
jgi:ectoine hydroxylase-related dioxygenase (phytanoyl-CoA dioxygenase family)